MWVIIDFSTIIQNWSKSLLHGWGDESSEIYGHVEQISPAAGSEFSVLKPDNATGNFTKVVQRISVRIAIGLIQIKKALKNYDQVCLWLAL